MPDEKPQGNMIAVAVAAKLLMVTDERLRQLVKLSYIKRSVRGQYDLVDVVQGYIKFLKDEERKGSKIATQTRMQDAKTAEIEMRIAEKRRELIPVEDHHAALDIVVGKVRSEFSGLPSRFTRDMPTRRKLEIEVNASFNRVADAVAASAKFIAEGGELPTGSGSDDA